MQPTRLLELNNDHSAVEGYSQDMFIDYNTYTPETYNLQDIIDKLNAEETSDLFAVSFSQDQLIQLTNEKERRLDLFDKRQGLLLRNCSWRSWRERCHWWKSLHQMNGWSMKIRLKWQRLSKALPDPYRRFVLKRNNKNYKGGTHKTRFMSTAQNLWNRKINKGYI